MAFLATALTTCGAIVLGYVTDSLPEWYLSDLDRAMIDAFHTNFGKVSNFFRSRLPRDRRTEALTRFALALSDQQLVMGPAMLIGAFANRCHISVIEFAMVVGLAWFSSTTHLATLDLLMDYFIIHGVVRNWRVLGMLITLALLCVALFLDFFSTMLDPGVPAQCALSRDGIFPLQGHEGESVLLILVLTLVILLSTYAIRIFYLYGEHGIQRNSPRLVTVKVSSVILRRRLWRQQPDLSAEDLSRRVAVLVAEHQARSRLERLSRMIDAKGIQRDVRLVLYAYPESFLSTIPFMAFSLSYGISRVVDIRWNRAFSLKGANQLDVGQIVPLLLLVIPILAGAEIFYGEQPQFWRTIPP